MSTAPVTPAAPVATPKPAAAPFGFKSVGHFFSTAFTALKTATKYVEAKFPTFEAGMQEVEKVTSEVAVFVPQANTALVIERTIDAAAGEFLAIVNAADVAEGAKLVNVALDAATVQTFKQFIADQKSALASLGFKL
jgi:hypothetical protein